MVTAADAKRWTGQYGLLNTRSAAGTTMCSPAG